jgi:hypothetical protein
MDSNQNTNTEIVIRCVNPLPGLRLLILAREEGKLNLAANSLNHFGMGELSGMDLPSGEQWQVRMNPQNFHPW